MSDPKLWDSMTCAERDGVRAEADRLVRLSHGIMPEGMAMRAALDSFRRARRGLEIRRKSARQETAAGAWWNQEAKDGED